MPTTSSVPLNAEPALAEDRSKQHLPPKSYVDAVEGNAPAETTNGVNGTNGTVATTGANGAKDIGGGDVKVSHQTSVFRIVDTGAPAVEKKEAKEDEKGNRPQVERQEYSATV